MAHTDCCKNIVFKSFDLATRPLSCRAASKIHLINPFLPFNTTTNKNLDVILTALYFPVGLPVGVRVEGHRLGLPGRLRIEILVALAYWHGRRTPRGRGVGVPPVAGAGGSGRQFVAGRYSTAIPVLVEEVQTVHGVLLGGAVAGVSHLGRASGRDAWEAGTFQQSTLTDTQTVYSSPPAPGLTVQLAKLVISLNTKYSKVLHYISTTPVLHFTHFTNSLHMFFF